MDDTPQPERAGLRYQLKVRGTLNRRWSVWFEGFDVKHEADGSTTLSGAVKDDAALYGLISKARDLGLTLISVQCTPAQETDMP